MVKKVLKIIGIAILGLILIWGLYVTVDVIRLRTIKYGARPLITLESIDEETKLYYTGLGYNVTYSIHKEQKYDMVNIRVYGGEFRLFNKILIWAWIE